MTIHGNSCRFYPHNQLDLHELLVKRKNNPLNPCNLWTIIDLQDKLIRKICLICMPEIYLREVTFPG